MTHFWSLLIGATLASLVVVVHFSALSIIERATQPRQETASSLLGVMFALLAAHVVEIWIYAAGYALSANVLGIATSHPPDLSFWDFAYFSAMVYTTVGFGDILPGDGLRMIAASEALTGLALITWSASYTFLHMNKIWNR